MFILPVHFIAANFHNNLSSKEESLPADFLSPSAGYIRASMQLKTNWWQDFLWLCVTCFRTWREMGSLSRACFTFLLLWSLQFVLIAQWYSSHLKKQSLPLVTSEYKCLLARMKNVWTIKNKQLQISSRCSTEGGFSSQPTSHTGPSGQLRLRQTSWCGLLGGCIVLV